MTLCSVVDWGIGSSYINVLVWLEWTTKRPLDMAFSLPSGIQHWITVRTQSNLILSTLLSCWLCHSQIEYEFYFHAQDMHSDRLYLAWQHSIIWQTHTSITHLPLKVSGLHMIRSVFWLPRSCTVRDTEHMRVRLFSFTLLLAGLLNIFQWRLPSLRRRDV